MIFMRLFVQNIPKICKVSFDFQGGPVHKQ